MSVVKEDLDGIKVQAGGYIFRPGVPQYTLRPGLRHDDGGLKKGDVVKARHMGGTPIGVITLPDGEKLYWENEIYRQEVQ